MADKFKGKRNTEGFDKHPENAGRPKGKKNRATVLKQLLKLGDTETKVNQALIDKAIQGDVRAFQEIYDTIFGKNVEKIESKTQAKIKGITFRKE